MKKLFILITLLTFSIGGFATSTPTHGTEKNPVIEGKRDQTAAPSMDFRAMEQAEGPALAVEAEEMAIPEAKTDITAPAIVAKDGKVSKKALKAKIRKERKAHKAKIKTQRVKRHKVKRERPGREKRSHGGGGTLGILALIFGVLGFVLAWFALPLGILLAIAAIVCGAIGMGGEQRGMALGGLIMGILTFLIPVLIVALIIAILL